MTASPHAPGSPRTPAGLDLARWAPGLLAQARALLRLPGGPEDRLGPGEIVRAARAVEALHSGLVGERALAHASTYDAAEALGAYLLWWWPQSYAKVRAAVERIPVPLPRGPRVLDLGAGPGPAALALLDALQGQALALDASEPALAAARKLVAARADRSLRTRRSDLTAGLPELPERFDLVIAAHVLSELPAGLDARAALVAQMAARYLAPGGLLILIEPALRETGRALLEVRDRVLRDHSAGDLPLRAVAPCLTQQPCPALAHPRDWCTAEKAWEPPRFVVQLARELGLHAHESLSYAHLVLGSAEPLAAADRRLWRVVGRPPAEKGKTRLFICAENGRLPLSRLDRHAGPDNAAIDSAERGDLLFVDGAEPRGDGLRAVPGAVVRAVEPAGPGEPGKPAQPGSANPPSEPGPAR